MNTPAPSADPDDVEIPVVLPLPVDIAATLTRAIGTLWPNSTMDMTNHSRNMVFRVAASDRLADDLDLNQVRAARVAMREEQEGIITRLGKGEAAGAPPPEYTRYILALAEAFLAGHGAVNYVEQTVHAPGEEGRIVITTQWAKGQTPASSTATPPARSWPGCIGSR